MNPRILAFGAGIVVVLMATALVAMPEGSIFKQLDFLEAETEAGHERSRVLLNAVETQDRVLDDTIADVNVARRAATPVRQEVHRTMGAWINGLKAQRARPMTDDARLTYLLQATAQAALEKRLKDREVLDRADLIAAHYHGAVHYRTQLTVQLAQTRARTKVTQDTRDTLVESADEADIKDEIRSTDEALNRSLSHLLTNDTTRDFHRLKGTLLPPVSKYPKSAFGPQSAGKKVTIRHTGLTYRVDAGTEVKAAAGGLIVYAHRFEGYGNTIIIDHGQDYHTIYAHLDRIDVKTGTKVVRGHVLGVSGDSGSLDGPKLYFELRHEGQAIDPQPWLLQREK